MKRSPCNGSLTDRLLSNRYSGSALIRNIQTRNSPVSPVVRSFRVLHIIEFLVESDSDWFFEFHKVVIGHVTAQT